MHRKAALLIYVVMLLSACNPIYVVQAGITQSEILLNRRPLDDVVQDPQTPAEITRKLKLVADVRDFSKTLALEPGGSFKAYSALNRDTLAWIVMASKPDSFTFYTWWFPIVGSVPYKGFFSQKSANCSAQRLQADGYETLVRGTEAFSTLGWFNDPVMTPMLKHNDPEIANTVIHEILHTTLWIPDYVAFNESLANFIGHLGAISYYQALVERCTREGAACSVENKQHLAEAERNFQQALEISRTLEVLIPELQLLYASKHSREDKINLRETIFAQHINSLRELVPELRILKKAHNAELMQLQLYYSKLDLFLKLWNNSAGNWDNLLNQLREIGTSSRQEHRDPFIMLAERTCSLTLQ